MDDEAPGHDGWFYHTKEGLDWSLDWYKWKIGPLRSNKSRSWANATAFALYLQSSRRAIKVERYQLELGDVVQLRGLDRPEVIYHAAMVTKIEWADPMPVPKQLE